MGNIQYAQVFSWGCVEAAKDGWSCDVLKRLTTLRHTIALHLGKTTFQLRKLSQTAIGVFISEKIQILRGTQHARILGKIKYLEMDK